MAKTKSSRTRLERKEKKEKKRKEKLRRQQNIPCINEGKGDTLSAMSLPHQMIQPCYNNRSRSSNLSFSGL
jgi:hypothetical protein